MKICTLSALVGGRRRIIRTILLARRDKEGVTGLLAPASLVGMMRAARALNGSLLSLGWMA
jgi:hypothetical protein